jgi:lipopolysaccharide export system protein LptA
MFRIPEPSLLLLTAALLFGASPTAVVASPQDTREPITIEADKAKVDEKQGISTYTGNVLLRQGGIQIKAETLTVHSLEGELEKVVATGAPVTYFQKGDAEASDISGEARRMEYFANENRLVLLESAKLSQGPNQFKGNRITYDTLREVVSATVSETGKDRVQVTIQPKKKEDK